MNPLKNLCPSFGNNRNLFFLFLIFSLGYNSVIAQSWQQLDSIRIMHQDNRQIDSALFYASKALDAAKLEVGEMDTTYANLLFNLARMNFNLGHNSEAISYCEQECQIRKEIQKDDPIKYVECLNMLAVLYRRTGHFEKAEITFIEAVETTEERIGKEAPILINLLNNMGQLCFNQGKYEKALEMFSKALDIIKALDGKENPLYSTLLNNLAGIYTTLGEYDKALPLYLEALEITENTLGKNHRTYSIRLNSLAQLYQRLGQYERALPLFIEAVRITEITVGKESNTYSVNLNNLASTYRLMGDFTTALSLYKEVVEISEKVYGKDHHEYGNRINNLGSLYSIIGDYEKALHYFVEALENAERNFGKNHSIYSSRLNNLATSYNNLGEDDKALPLYYEVLEIAEKTLGPKHPNYSVYLSNLANIYDNKNVFDEAYDLYLKSYQNNLFNIDKAFTFLSESEKESFIKRISSSFNTYQSFFLRYNNENPAVGSDSYNLELVTKGMILQSGIEMRQAILSQGDEIALEKYDEWAKLRTELSKQYSLPISERIEDIGDIEANAERLEGELTRLSSSFNKINRLTDVKWQDVKANLKQNELAIEFASYRYLEGKKATDSIVYVALLIRYNDPHPLIVPLCEQKQLEELFEQNYTNNYNLINSIYGTKDNRTEISAKLYNLIWQPLEKYLENAENIYVAPSGLLHKISFAAISNNNGKFLCELYNLNLISSTSQIRDLSKEPLKINNAAFFGGVDYNGPATKNEIWDYLPGTLIEVEKLSELFKKADIEKTVFTGIYATEENFKTIAGKTDILHVATHGFFYPDPDQIKNREQEVVIPGDVEFRGGVGPSIETFKNNTNPLMRSGLAFSGANDVWDNTERQTSTEDGLLTAHEVANLNLQNTQLVVLSACETGLGDIKGSEGVYGLQRAFKMAGVQYLIMSLWQVPDKETVEFMEIFYNKLLTSNDIRLAFNETQREMRQKYDPFFWAAFVLVE